MITLANSGVSVSLQRSHYIKLAHKGPFSAAAVVKPPPGGGGEGSTVVGAPPVWLVGDLSLPVLKAQPGAALVKPVPLCDHVVDAQPDVFLLADALTDVVVEFVILGTGQRGAEDAPQGHAVVIGGMEVLLRLVR